MKRSVALAVIGLLVFAGSAVEAKPGEISTGEVSPWDSTVPFDLVNGIFPIGGDGQVNGEFTIAERDGIQIALRAQDRFVGPIPVQLRGNKGRYQAAAGFSTGNAATWNYDWHVDLRGTGTTIADYDLTLTQTFAPMLLGTAGPFDLTFGLLPGNAVLYQSSQNPTFFNDTFDPTKRGTYNLKLTLKPKRGGKPLSVQIQVTVR